MIKVYLSDYRYGKVNFGYTWEKIDEVLFYY